MMKGFDNHAIRLCGVNTGMTANYKHWKDRYNIWVSSITSTTPTRTFTGTVKGYHTKGAKEVYDLLPKHAKSCTYPLVGCVIQRGTFAVRAPTNRKYYKPVSVFKKKCQKCRKWHYQKFNVFILG